MLWNFPKKVLFGKSDSVGPNSMMKIVFDHTYIYIYIFFYYLNNELNIFVIDRDFLRNMKKINALKSYA